MRMSALRFHGAGDVRVDEVQAPGPPPPGEVLVQVRACGICGSDALEYARGPVLIAPPDAPHPVTGHSGPLTLGHELAGEVVALGEGVGGISEGDLIACGAGMSCGGCGPCLRGRTNLCERYATIGFHRDGGLAQRCLLPADICFDAGILGLTADAAALAQPMAIAVHAARRGGCPSDGTAVVLGAGGIGAFLTYALASGGARVIVCDLNAGRLDLAAQLGAAQTIELSAERPLGSALSELGAVPDVIFEASGSAGALGAAVDSAPRGGRIVAVGVQKAPPELDMRRVTLDELELLGTVAHVGRADMPEALRLIASRAQGWADVAPLALPLKLALCDGILPLAEGRSEQVKTLIDPGAGATRPTDTAPRGEAARALGGAASGEGAA